MLAAAKSDDPAISKGVFVGTLAGLLALDVEVEALLARLGLRVADLDELPERLTPAAFYDLWQAVTEVTGERGLGLRVAERIRPEQFAMFGDVVATSATLADALTRGLRLFRLLSECVRFSAEFAGRRAGLSLEVLHSGKFHLESAEFLLVAVVAIARRITGAEINVLEARFTHEAPEDAGYIERFFGCSVSFRAWENAIVFDSAVLLLPVVDHDAARCAALYREAESLLADVTQPSAFHREVVSAISHQIAAGDSSIELVAGRMGLHPKALGRRLRAEGTTFSRLLDEVRLGLARRYLEQPGLSIAEIAFRLAYSDRRAFNRAFKRWTGSAPDNYRRK